MLLASCSFPSAPSRGDQGAKSLSSVMYFVQFTAMCPGVNYSTRLDEVSCSLVNQEAKLQHSFSAKVCSVIRKRRYLSTLCSKWNSFRSIVARLIGWGRTSHFKTFIMHWKLCYPSGPWKHPVACHFVTIYANAHVNSNLIIALINTIIILFAFQIGTFWRPHR